MLNKISLTPLLSLTLPKIFQDRNEPKCQYTLYILKMGGHFLWTKRSSTDHKIKPLVRQARGWRRRGQWLQSKILKSLRSTSRPCPQKPNKQARRQNKKHTKKGEENPLPLLLRFSTLYTDTTQAQNINQIPISTVYVITIFASHFLLFNF